jgi:hypothetical protein
MADKPPEETQHSTADYANYAQPEKPIRNWTRIFSIFIVVLILLGVGAGIYEYLKHHKSAKPLPAKSASTTPIAITPTTKSYTSPNLFLTFSYPSNWTVVDSGNGLLTATSPTMQLKDINSKEVNGTIVMTIRNTASQLPGFTAGNNATAVIASVNITYTHPTQTQRASTYISFLTYSSTAGNNGLDAIYISGNNGYTLGQAIPQADLIQVSPVISLTFLNGQSKPLTLTASDWGDSAFSTPILDMLKSLALT